MLLKEKEAHVPDKRKPLTEVHMHRLGGQRTVQLSTLVLTVTLPLIVVVGMGVELEGAE